MLLVIILAICFSFVTLFGCASMIFAYHYNKKHLNRRVANSSPVVVTSATHTAPGGYAVTTQMPVGSSPYQTNAYHYPAQMQPQMMQMPMPMPGMPPVAGVQQHATPYPPPMQMPMPAPATGSNMNPPSYDMAVSGGPAQQPNYAGYEKQSPYNPTYASH